MSSYLTRHTFAQMWFWQATHKDAASYIPQEKYTVLHDAALNACDALDGLKDGIIGDVERCRFDPVVTQCKGGDAPSCLTAPQVEAARKIYAGPTNPRTKQELYSPMYPGSELGWGQLAGGEAPLGIPVEFFKYYVFKDPNWDYKTRPVDFDKDVALADKPEIQPVNAVDPDLTKFFARGGKLLLVDGWNDTAVPPKVAINYYQNVLVEDRRQNGEGIDAVLHGARDGARPGHERRRELQLRCPRRHRTVEADREGARSAHRRSLQERDGSRQTPRVSVPAGRDLQGQREYGRPGQLCLQMRIGELVNWQIG